MHGHFDALFSYSLNDALPHLEHHLDIGLCGLHFDDSCMFELLHGLKSDKATRHILFICLNTKNSVLPSSVIRIAAKAVVTMGGDGFIDLCRWRCVLGDERALARFRAHLQLLRPLVPPTD